MQVYYLKVCFQKQNKKEFGKNTNYMKSCLILGYELISMVTARKTKIKICFERVKDADSLTRKSLIDIHIQAQ